ncbi:ferritin-like domain-containing protein [Lophiotrema nucula]|uniref:Ferritin-like domain-containing protein n=1 Tax=Lophiotrema nucula TaxID=690887 RepID=A0A6A5YX64_9PLEO|nr:ferritin-like domain-containing protein [Lophiotrema nucula]
MLSRSMYASALLSTLAAAAPAPQVSGYTNADAGFPQTPSSLGTPASVFGPDSQVAASAVTTISGYPRVSANVTGATSHGPYSGTATTTGAVTANTTLATGIAPLPPNPTATYYNAQGVLLNPAPAPYTPNGGLGTNGTEPRYMVNSDFDFESIALGLYQEWIELDLFNNGLAVFSEEDFLAAGLTAEDRAYIAFMAVQETGHATLLTNMLGEAAPPQCTYDYPFTTVREFIDFNQKLTRFGESGVWGFINHLDSREVGQLLAQSIATEARQQMSFRQMLGLHPMPVWFETGIPQSWAWTYLAPYISSCPENTTRLAWQNFPTLHIINQANPNRFSPNDTKDNEVTGQRIIDPSNSTLPANESCVNVNVTGYGCGPAIAHNRSEPLTFPGKLVNLTWDVPGQAVGPNNSYVTSTSAGAPSFVAWVSQLNLTYTPLEVTGANTGYTFQPASEVYQGDPAANDTMFIAITDSDLFLTPFNLSMINPHVVALGLYQAG